MNTIQQIFQDHAEAYLKQFGRDVPEAHRRVIHAIYECRTGLRGEHLYQCPHCHRTQVANSSCGNRHCPVCQHRKSVDWVYNQQLKLLPCTYFLATFTLPPELRDVARRNPRPVYRAVMNCASDALRTLEADKRFVGCRVAGFFGVLHTWGRQLQYHPHAHFVIPGGGLSGDRNRWVAATGNFLVHVRALSALFRGKMRAALGRQGLSDEIPADVWKRDWIVHCKCVGDGRAAMKYLGAYVFRVAVSDARIAHYDRSTVTIRYRKVGSSRQRHMRLSSFEFIRRYLQHVLPTGFMKVRHYGFLSPNFSVPIQKIRELICVLYELIRDALPGSPAKPRYRPVRCPECNTVMRHVRFRPAIRLQHDSAP